MQRQQTPIDGQQQQLMLAHQFPPNKYTKFHGCACADGRNVDGCLAAREMQKEAKKPNALFRIQRESWDFYPVKVLVSFAIETQTDKTHNALHKETQIETRAPHMHRSTRLVKRCRNIKQNKKN